MASRTIGVGSCTLSGYDDWIALFEIVYYLSRNYSSLYSCVIVGVWVWLFPMGVVSMIGSWPWFFRICRMIWAIGFGLWFG